MSTILILGAGKNVGASVARMFAQKGYKVAIAARQLQDTTDSEGKLTIAADLADPKSVGTVFDKVENAFGPINVVVYNAASAKFVPAQSPLELDIDDFEKDLTINTTSAFAAAKRAVQSFGKASADVPKTFIYTGNFLNTEVVVPLFSAGVGKSASAHLLAACSLGYRDRGYRFYFADERKEDGGSAGGAISGPAHAEFYYELATGIEERPWLQTFVAGKGYQKFAGSGYVKDASKA